MWQFYLYVVVSVVYSENAELGHEDIGPNSTIQLEDGQANGPLTDGGETLVILPKVGFLAARVEKGQRKSVVRTTVIVIDSNFTNANFTNVDSFKTV